MQLTLDVANVKGSAVLTTTGTLDMESITRDLVETEYLMKGKYKLLTRTEAQNYDFTYKGYSIVSTHSTTGGCNIILHGSVSIPEPTTATLSLLALAALAARRRRK